MLKTKIKAFLAKKCQFSQKAEMVLNLMLVISLIANFLLPFSTRAVDVNNNPEILKLNAEIEEKTKQLEELARQKQIYQENINIKKGESVNLKNQIDILDNEIAKYTIEIQKSEIDIEKTNLEIADRQIKIENKELNIASKKEKLTAVLRQLNKNGQQDSFLEMLVLNDSLGSFFAQVGQLEAVSDELKTNVIDLKQLRADLQEEKSQLEDKKKDLDAMKAGLETEKEKLDGNKSSKEVLFLQTKGEEIKFQSLYNKLIQEQKKVNETIQDLEIQTRKKILQLQKVVTNETGIIWPVPSRKITATFHDPDYPFRYIFEHPGIDIGSTPQSTEVRAAGSGYVAIAKNGGLYGYSYVMIVHPNGLSTVYGHLSQIKVTADSYVVQGEVIGLSGGMPGTPGAGYLTTGPHLHFEVRMNGIPVDPTLYLP